MTTAREETGSYDKWWDSLLSTSPVSATPNIHTLAQMSTGFTQNTRVGTIIRHHSLELIGEVYAHQSRSMGGSSFPSPSQICRIIIVKDWQPSLPMVATDVLTQSHPLSNYNLNKAERFTILFDRTWVVDPFSFQTVGAAAAWNRTIHFYSHRIPVESPCVWASDDPTSITTGAIRMLFIGNGSPLSSNDHCTTNYTVRVHYSDA